MSIFGDCNGGVYQALTICQVCYYALYKVYLSQTTTISSISGRNRSEKQNHYKFRKGFVAGIWPYTIMRAGCLHIWCWNMKPSGEAVRKGRWIWTEGEKERTKTHKNGLKPCQIFFASDLVLQVPCPETKRDTPGLGVREAEGGFSKGRRARQPTSRFLAWRIPRDRGAWRATGHGVAKS